MGFTQATECIMRYLEAFLCDVACPEELVGRFEPRKIPLFSDLPFDGLLLSDHALATEVATFEVNLLCKSQHR